MADNKLISKVTLGGVTYDLKDKYAREKLLALEGVVTGGVQIKIVNELPTASRNTVGKIYFISHTHSEKDIYDEYLTIIGGTEETPTYFWEKIGNTDIDLSGYAKKTDIPKTLPASDVYAWAKASTKPSYTASEVGLGNVPNVTTNDQTPSYTEATTLAKLTSGEKLSVAFGKISKAITDLISHIGDSVKHITSTERTNWGIAYNHSQLSHAPADAQKNVQSDWNATSGDAFIKNKPSIPSEITEDTVSGWGFTKNTGTYSKPSTGIPKTDLASAVQTSLGKADTALQSFTETDPTVPAWAKASSKPSYTASEVGALANTVTHLSGDVPTTRKVNGKALSADITLTASDVGADASGSASSALASAKSYTDTEIANLVGTAPETMDTLEEVAQAIKDHQDVTDALNAAIGNKVDKVSGKGLSTNDLTNTLKSNYDSAYTHSQSTHARTDATKVEKSSTNGNIKINGTETTVYTHPSGTNPHGTTKSDVGLGNVGNFKAVSTVANQGLSDTEKSNARANIGAGTSSFSGSYNDLTNKPTIPSVGNGTVTIKQAGTSKGTFTMNQSGNTTIELTDSNTTYSDMKGATSSAAGTHGLVPAPASGKQSSFLRGDGTWAVPTDTNTWRGIQNNLTSDSTTDSLSAAQGKVLKGLVDGKVENTETGVSSALYKLEIDEIPIDADSNACFISSIENDGTFKRIPFSSLLNKVLQWIISAGMDGNVRGVKVNNTTKTPDENGTVDIGTFLTAHPTVSKSTDSTSTASPSAGGTFTTVDSVTRDSNGHVTKVNTKTVTLPSNSITVDSALSSTSTNPVQNKVINTALSGKASSTHTHNYAGSSSAGGSATSAVKLDTASAGSTTQPVYFSGGKPVACSYTLGKSVPSDAVFSEASVDSKGIMSVLDKCNLEELISLKDIFTTAGETIDSAYYTVTLNKQIRFSNYSYITVKFEHNNYDSNLVVRLKDGPGNAYDLCNIDGTYMNPTQIDFTKLYIIRFRGYQMNIVETIDLEQTLKSNIRSYGLVKLSISDSVTDYYSGLALSATEKNPNVSGSLAATKANRNWTLIKNMSTNTSSTTTSKSLTSYTEIKIEGWIVVNTVNCMVSEITGLVSTFAGSGQLRLYNPTNTAQVITLTINSSKSKITTSTNNANFKYKVYAR